MPRVGKCLDNEPMENSRGMMKEKMYGFTIYEIFEKLENNIKQYIEFCHTKGVSLKMGVSIPA